jgi:hypothetical protein
VDMHQQLPGESVNDEHTGLAQGRIAKRGLDTRTAILLAVIAGLLVIVVLLALLLGASPLRQRSLARTEQPTVPTMPVGEFNGFVTVFLTEDVTEAQRAAVSAAIAESPAVDEVTFETREEAFERFKVMFKDQPDMLEDVQAEDLPEAFKARLHGLDRYGAFVAHICPGKKQVPSTPMTDPTGFAVPVANIDDCLVGVDIIRAEQDLATER